MANQILAGAVFNAGQVIAGVDADNPPYVGPVQYMPENTNDGSTTWNTIGSNLPNTRNATELTWNIDNSSAPMTAFGTDGWMFQKVSEPSIQLNSSYVVSLKVLNATSDLTVRVVKGNTEYGFTPSMVTSLAEQTIPAGDYTNSPQSVSMTVDIGATLGTWNDTLMIQFASAAGYGTFSIDDVLMTDVPPAPPIIASAPTYLRSIEASGDAQKIGAGISIHEDYIFVSNGRSSNQGELFIYDATDLNVPPVLFNPPQYGGQDWGQNHHYDSTRKLLIVGNGYAAMHSGSNSGGVISFYDLTDINNIVTIREYGGPGVNQYIGATVAVGGGKAYTSKTTGAFGEENVLYSFDLDNLQAGPVKYDRPSHVVDTRDYWGRHMDADDEYLYVWDQMGDRIVYIYDVNNPLTLITTANYPVAAGDINYRPVIAGDYWLMTRYGNPAVSIFEKGTGNLVKVIGKGVDWLNSSGIIPAGDAIDTGFPTYNNGARMYGKYLGLWSPSSGEYGTPEYEIDMISFYDTTDWSVAPIILTNGGRGGGSITGEDGSSSIALNPVNNELWWGSGNHNGESSVVIFDASSIVNAT